MTAYFVPLSKVAVEEAHHSPLVLDGLCFLAADVAAVGHPERLRLAGTLEERGTEVLSALAALRVDEIHRRAGRSP